ncbi:MAG: amidohydrolase family protein [Acidimicrobiales bacterium]
MSVLFTNVFVYSAHAPGGVVGPTDVLVTGQRIAAVGALVAPEGGRIVAGKGRHLLVPGLINAHFHSPANHLKGSLASMPLEMFMLYESPADDRLCPSPREAYLRTVLATLEMLRTGTTTVQDDAFLMPVPEPEIIDAVLQAYEDCGIRASVALDQPELAETDKLPFLAELAPPELRQVLGTSAPMPRGELLELYGHLFARWHGAADGRLSAAVSISAPQRVSVEYFEALDELSRKHRVPLYAHVLETKAQRVLLTEQPRFAGRSLVGYIADLGLLNERMNIIHAVWVDDADLDLIAASGAVVVHNPVSNLRLGSGVMPFRAMRNRGIPIALGVDEAICNDAVDMWNVVKMTGLIHNISGLDSDDWPTAAEVLEALWQGGSAAMLRTGDLGEITVGSIADIAMIDMRTIAFTPLNDITGQLVYCESGTSVVLTMVDGKVVAENGRVTSVDETALLDEAREIFAAKQPALRRSSVEAGRLLPTYLEMVRRAAAADVGMTRWVGTR